MQEHDPLVALMTRLIRLEYRVQLVEEGLTTMSENVNAAIDQLTSDLKAEETRIEVNTVDATHAAALAADDAAVVAEDAPAAAPDAATPAPATETITPASA